MQCPPAAAEEILPLGIAVRSILAALRSISKTAKTPTSLRADGATDKVVAASENLFQRPFHGAPGISLTRDLDTRGLTVRM